MTLKDRFTNTLNKGAASIKQMLNSMKSLGNKTDDVSDRMVRGASRVQNAWSSAGSMIRSVLTALGARKVIELSDSVISTNARLNLITDPGQRVGDLSADIMASAQRSRAAYLDTAAAVAQLRSNAGAAFGSNDETIAFLEQVNKMFVIGGASASAQTGAMTQLTQAMAAGALRGDELNSILEAAPGIARAIEKYMGIAEGSIKSVAEQGLVTAGVVKNALFDMADETNAKFESMPKTYAQVWTQIKNAGLSAFSGVLTRLNEFLNSGTGTALVNSILSGINIIAGGISRLMDLITGVGSFVTQNWDIIQPILVTAIPAALAVIIASMVLWGITSVQAAVATITAMSPIILVALAIGAAIGVVIAIAMKMGATFDQVCGFIGGLIYGIGAAFHNTGAWIYNTAMSVTDFLMNCFIHPIYSINKLFYDFGTGVIDIISGIAKAIDSVFGTNLYGALQGARNLMTQMLGEKPENYRETVKMEMIPVEQAMKNGYSAGQGIGQGITDTVGDLFSFNTSDPFGTSNMTDAFSFALDGANIGSLGEVGKINTEVNIADEDIKLMKDVAEMRYVQNFVTLQPSISMSATVTKDADFDAFYDQFGQRLTEEIESDAEGVYS